MKYFGAFILAIVTGGAVDYLPEANKPWVVDFRNPNRYAGRGKTLWQATRHYFTGGHIR